MANNIAAGETVKSLSDTSATEPLAWVGPTNEDLKIFGPRSNEAALYSNQERLGDGGSLPELAHLSTLFNQFMASSFPDENAGPLGRVLSQIASNEEQLLVRPHA